MYVLCSIEINRSFVKKKKSTPTTDAALKIPEHPAELISKHKAVPNPLGSLRYRGFIISYGLLDRLQKFAYAYGF